MTANGWPFLVARGRRRGYSVLLAPGFLVAGQDHGFLERVVGPVRDGRPFHTATVTTPRGRRVSLVWSDYPAGDADLCDEHSRPLRLLGGFLSADAGIDRPSDTDLAYARAAAAATYRRFLADEEAFTTERSEPFGLRSDLVPQPRHTPTERRPPARPNLPLAAIGLVVAALVAVVIVLISSSVGGGTPPPLTCVTTPQATKAGLVVPTTTTGPPTPTTAPGKC